MADDAHKAYSRNRYQSSLLPAADSEIQYGSLSSKAVTSNSFSAAPSLKAEYASKSNYLTAGGGDGGFPNVMRQTGPGSVFGADSPPVSDPLQDVKGKVDALLSDHVAVVRMASHLSVLMIAGALLVFSQLKLPNLDISLSSLSNNITSATLSQAEPTATTTSNTLALIQSNSQGSGVFDIALPRMVVPLIQSAQPQVAAAPEVVEIRTYTVQPGDTIFGIAQRLGLNPESLQWANPTLENNPDLLNIGDQLKIPPMDGVLHTVRSGDTLNGIAQRYKVAVDTIIGFTGNKLKDANSSLVLDQEIFVPGGVKPFQAPAQLAVIPRASTQTPYNALKGSGAFAWPATGQITQYYWRGHPGIDVASWVGNPVKSADSGYVVEVVGGWSSGYGLHVIIDHGNGFQTLYAHLSSVWVSTGENVSKGQQIGAVGSTGNSTGPHLHFEVRYQGVGQNPLSYLR